jgi:hypothetical protein
MVVHALAQNFRKNPAAFIDLQPLCKYSLKALSGSAVAI